jgi:hypothetical protein
MQVQDGRACLGGLMPAFAIWSGVTGRCGDMDGVMDPVGAVMMTFRFCWVSCPLA